MEPQERGLGLHIMVVDEDKILSGANDVHKRKVIKAFIKMQRVDVVCL